MAVIDSYPESNYSTALNVYNSAPVYGTALGQSFKGLGVPLNSCQFYLKKYGSPSGTIVAKLYAHTGTFGSEGTATGAALATSDTLNITDLNPSSLELKTFTFSTPYTPVWNTPYVVVVEYTGGNSSNYLTVGIDDSSPTHPGNGVYYNGSWASFSGDVIFYVNTTSAVPVGVRAVGTTVTDQFESITLGIPAATQTGDLMVAFVLSDGVASGITEPADWSTIDNSTSYIGIFYKFHDGSETNPAFTDAANTLCGCIVSFYNVNTTTPLDVAYGNSTYSAPSSPYDVTITGFDTATDGALAIFTWASIDDSTWAYRSGGHTQVFQVNQTSASDRSMGVGYLPKATAGGTGNQVEYQSTKGGDAGGISWFALKPVATAAGPSGLKTINDLAKANVKVINGVTMANTKTWGTLAELIDRIIWRKAA